MTAPIRCFYCGDEDGPFALSVSADGRDEHYVCEACYSERAAS